MNKKLIAAAIAAVVAAPAVSAADTTLYGKAHVDIRSNDATTSGGSGDGWSANSNASRLGVKGSEDLGDGLKAIFGYEMGYNITDTDTGGPVGNTLGGASPISARNAYVGLAGGWGTFLVGRHDTPAKIAFYAADNDLLGDSIIDYNKIGFTEYRVDNAIAYVSPNFSGFTVAGAVVPGEQPGNATTATAVNLYPGMSAVAVTGPRPGNDGLADHYSLGLMYAGGGLKAGLGYEKVAELINLGAATSDQKMWQLGVSYTFGDFQVGATYESTSDWGTVSGLDKTVWGIAGKATFGNNYVIANAGKAKYDLNATAAATLAQTATDDDVTTYGVAIGHTFSKRTQVYAAYSNQDGGGATSPIGLNVDTSTFALGMIHSF